LRDALFISARKKSRGEASADEPLKHPIHPEEGERAQEHHHVKKIEGFRHGADFGTKLKGLPQKVLKKCGAG
jgi:hypothetical protein